MRGVLEVRAAGVRAGGLQILAGVDVEVWPGTVVGLVGPNGAGKTTLLDAVSGFAPLERGTVSLGGTDLTDLPPHQRARLGIGRTFQGLDLFEDLSVEENLQVPSRRRLVADLGDLAERMPPTLAHDQRQSLALARALAGEPDVLLLDEPAAGLDVTRRRRLIARLRSLAETGVGVLIADHDLDLVSRVCERVYVLDFGRVIASGPPAAVRADPAVTAAYLGTARGTARRAPAETGEPLLMAKGVRAGYGGAAVLHGVDLQVHEGEVVALLGPNGAGKTTTLRAVSGGLPLQAGDVTFGGRPVNGRPHRLARLGLAHVPQGRAVLGSLTVTENLRLSGRGSRKSRRQAVDQVLSRFPGLAPLLPRRAGRLSGGEQQLLALARAFAGRPRLLLVDELSLGLAPRPARQAIEAVQGAAEEGAGVLLVEQHPGLALEVADRAVVLSRGDVVYAGPAAELVARPELLEAAYLGATGSPPSEE
jgi:branched-chain amino acid transport system ATP-binding protein